MFGCSLAVLQLVLCFVCRVQTQTTETTFQPIFKQDEFVRNSKSKEMLKFMNLSADPCQDFYAFACGNWQKYHTNLKEKEISTTLRFLEDKVDRDLQFLLKEEVTLNDGFNGRKVKDFYKSCKNALANGQHQQAFYSEFIKLNEGFPAAPGSNWEVFHPNYDWQEVVADLRYHYHMDILIGINVNSNPQNLYEDTIYLTEPSTILPKDLCNTEIERKINRRRNEYEAIEKEVATNLKSWLSINSPDAEKVANAILLFELELCRAMSEKVFDADSENNSNVNYTRRTLHEFTSHFNDSIDFYKFVSRSYNMPFPRPATMHSEQYYRNLIKTIQIRDKATIANYIMYRALSFLSFPLNDNKETRPSFCTQIIKRYFPQVLGSMYYHKFANLAVKNDIESIFDKLKIGFENSLRSNWLEEGTSRVGLGKLNDISLYLPNYEEKINLNHLNINATHYWHNLAQVMSQPQSAELKRLLNSENMNPNDEIEAYDVRIKFRVRHKRIDVGWALLQPPYFQQNYPHSMLYAMIGQKLGRELASAFNDLGWTSDALNLSNWDHITALAYKNRSECFREQISFYLSNDGGSFQNITELREIIAITAGMNVAFAAYLNWLDFLNPNNDFTILRKETLPELNFTNTQLFFITYAQMYCHSQDPNKTVTISCPLLQHNLERYKVNGPLWNSLEFGKEFGCPIGTEMNQADKCIIY